MKCQKNQKQQECLEVSKQKKKRHRPAGMVSLEAVLKGRQKKLFLIPSLLSEANGFTKPEKAEPVNKKAIRAQLAAPAPGEEVSLNGLISRLADVADYAKRFQEIAKQKTEQLFL